MILLLFDVELFITNIVVICVTILLHFPLLNLKSSRVQLLSKMRTTTSPDRRYLGKSLLPPSSCRCCSRSNRSTSPRKTAL